MVYPHTGVSVINRSKVPTHGALWTDPEYTMLSKGTRHKRPRGVWFHLHEESGTGISTDRKWVRTS